MLQTLSNAQRRVGQNKAQGGFTLIELLVVIAIIAILAAIAIPQFNKYRANAMLSNVQQMAKSIAKMDIAVATSGVQNPKCSSATTTMGYTNTSSTGTTSVECTKDDDSCYIVSVANETACDAIALWDKTNNVPKPDWLYSAQSDVTITINGTSAQITGGTIIVKSTYDLGGYKLGCKYDATNDSLNDIDDDYLCHLK